MAVARLALGRFEDAALAAWEVSHQLRRWQHDQAFPSILACQLTFVQRETAEGAFRECACFRWEW